MSGESSGGIFSEKKTSEAVTFQSKKMRRRFFIFIYIICHVFCSAGDMLTTKHITVYENRRVVHLFTDRQTVGSSWLYPDVLGNNEDGEMGQGGLSFLVTNT